MFKKILIGLAAVLVILIVVIAMQPADFKIERQTVVAAPPEIVFGQVNDFRNWKDWSPWVKMDPAAEITISEVAAGTGATYAWVGKKTGAGSMAITESRPAEYLAIDLDFLKPFKASNEVVFTLAPIHGGTMIAWTMSGRNNFMSKAFRLFMDMDKMVGGDFEKGLADIKKNSEIASGWRTE
jgi:uncharacterized protein YndB with AHSA1/START domain